MRLPALLLFLFLSLRLTAQPYLDLLSVQGSAFPSKGLYKGKDQGTVPNDWWMVNVNLPLKINARNVLILSPGWEQRSFVYKDLDLVANYETEYLPVTYFHVFNDTTMAMSGTGIYRFNKARTVSFNGESDMLGGAVIFSKKASARFTWKAGLYYNKEFFGNYWLPLLGVDWRVTDRLFVMGLVPRNLIIDYCLSSHLHGGFAYKGLEESYREKNEGSYLKITNGQLKLFADYYFNKTPIVVTLEVGQTVASEYQQRAFENAPVQKTNPAENILIRGGISYRFVTNKAFLTPQTQGHY